jgi:TPR repeat protein
MILTDRVPDPDYAKAVEYFTRSAESGMVNPLFGLGECYYAGKGVEKDLEKAAEYYRKALEGGYEPDGPEEEAHVKEVLGEEVSAIAP